MKFAFVSTLLCIFLAVTLASPIATPVGDEFDLSFLEETIEARLDPHEYEALSHFIQKRDNGFENTFESLLNIVNDSGIIWAVMDQIAYYPNRIEFIANTTAGLIGGTELSDIGDLLSGLNLDLLDVNVSAIVKAVGDSGVVQSLLDGILLDEDYRPHLVNLVSRVLRSLKNLFLWLVEDVFGNDKNKRDESSGLETFVSNMLSTILSSTLVANVAEDFLTALNNTQFLTYNVKYFLANEGYQNMTAQLFIDVMNTGAVSLNGTSLNITSLTESLLSKPEVISGAVGFLLSGNLNLGGLGKYTDAIGEIVKGVEKEGTFAELNEYVFSESHTVSKPLLYTGQVVVPRTASFTLGGIGGFNNASKTTSGSSKTSGSTRASSSPTITSASNTGNSSDFTYNTSDDLNELESAAEVESILSLLNASPASETNSASSSSRSSARSSGSLAGSSVVSEATDSLSRWFETYSAGGDGDVTTTLSRSRARSLSSSRSRSVVTVTVDESTQTSSNGGFGGLFVGLFQTSSAGDFQRREVSQDSGASVKSVPMFLVYLQVLVFGGVLML